MLRTGIKKNKHTIQALKTKKVTVIVVALLIIILAIFFLYVNLSVTKYNAYVVADKMGKTIRFPDFEMTLVDTKYPTLHILAGKIYVFEVSTDTQKQLIEVLHSVYFMGETFNIEGQCYHITGSTDHIYKMKIEKLELCT